MIVFFSLFDYINKKTLVFLIYITVSKNKIVKQHNILSLEQELLKKGWNYKSKTEITW